MDLLCRLGKYQSVLQSLTRVSTSPKRRSNRKLANLRLEGGRGIFRKRFDHSLKHIERILTPIYLEQCLRVRGVVTRLSMYRVRTQPYSISPRAPLRPHLIHLAPDTTVQDRRKPSQNCC